MTIQIKSGSTAIARNWLSVPAQELLNFLGRKRQGYVFDLGHGRGGDMKKLCAKGFVVSGWDPNHHIEGYSHRSIDDVPKGIYDAVLVSYVLNVIPDPDERLETLAIAYEIAADNGIVVVGVRTVRDVMISRTDEWTRHGDGWVTSRDTFQKGFTAAEIVAMMEITGFEEMHVVSRSPVVVIGERL